MPSCLRGMRRWASSMAVRVSAEREERGRAERREWSMRFVARVGTRFSLPISLMRVSGTGVILNISSSLLADNSLCMSPVIAIDSDPVKIELAKNNGAYERDIVLFAASY